MPMKQILVVGSDPKVSQNLDEYLDPVLSN